MTRNQTNVAIPMYRVQIRHPKFGWQVVDVAEHRRFADQAFDKWVASVPFEVTLTKIVGDQIWRGIKSVDACVGSRLQPRRSK